ncbi:MAG TPA: phosphoglucosamine mutase, partial [Candidatus Limnocylindrales bacterium]
MPRLFGTDGIRGVANVDLKPTLAYALGRATAHRLVGRGGALVVGQDTRRSCDMFVTAIASGATSMGVDVHRVGVVPTPALAFLAGGAEFAAGIMVSASHNPSEDNGLKVLDRDGLKLDDAIEDELEQLVWRSEELGGVGNGELGRLVEAGGLLDRYRRHRLELAGGVHCEVRVVLDCANGSGGVVGPEIIAATGARVEVIHNAPDGVNINDGAGATAPASLSREVVARGADLGFALDGDADRLIVSDEH